mmetsp:Transcript_46283/g.116554  ORF Transcript_46283/g.116554 Transcript_46283/m.116554 type:complete len:93 (-) Transcript_46283:1775-2053(-)
MLVPRLRTRRNASDHYLRPLVERSHGIEPFPSGVNAIVLSLWDVCIYVLSRLQLTIRPSVALRTPIDTRSSPHRPALHLLKSQSRMQMESGK